jgi:hypothetical protein
MPVTKKSFLKSVLKKLSSNKYVTAVTTVASLLVVVDALPHFLSTRFRSEGVPSCSRLHMVVVQAQPDQQSFQGPSQ